MNSLNIAISIYELSQAGLKQDSLPPIKTDMDAQIHENAATSEHSDIPEPTPEEAQSGDYDKAPVQVSGLKILIENPYGTTRSGIDDEGNEWEQVLQDNYGEIVGTEGADNDPVDVFIAPHLTLDEADQMPHVHVVDQINPYTGDFDEHKVVIGYDGLDEAKDAYLSNYEDGWQGLGHITQLSTGAFKTWLKHGDTTQSLSGIDAPQRHDDANKWITINGNTGEDGNGGTHVELDEQGNIVKGMGGKFTGKNIKELGGTKKFTQYETNAEREKMKAERTAPAQSEAPSTGLKSFIASELENNRYKDTYKNNPERLKEFEAKTKDKWKQGLISRADNGESLTEQELDDFVAEYGKPALHSTFRGARESSVAGYVPADLRDEFNVQKINEQKQEQAIAKKESAIEAAEKKAKKDEDAIIKTDNKQRRENDLKLRNERRERAEAQSEEPAQETNAPQQENEQKPLHNSQKHNKITPTPEQSGNNNQTGVNEMNAPTIGTHGLVTELNKKAKTKEAKADYIHGLDTKTIDTALTALIKHEKRINPGFDAATDKLSDAASRQVYQLLDEELMMRTDRFSQAPEPEQSGAKPDGVNNMNAPYEHMGTDEEGLAHFKPEGEKAHGFAIPAESGQEPKPAGASDAGIKINIIGKNGSKQENSDMSLRDLFPNYSTDFEKNTKDLEIETKSGYKFLVKTTFLLSDVGGGIHVMVPTKNGMKKWNGKIYQGKYVYLDGNKVNIENTMSKYEEILAARESIVNLIHPKRR